MATYSIFTETMKELLSYSKRIDTATPTNTDFIDLQKLEAKIVERYKAGYYNYNRYRILMNTALDLHKEMREVIRLNEQIREIDRRIDKERKAAI